ncbi:uncharacterized protein LOC141854287 [Brevipalpus obovatus]|uniref:uncharacterized protein LOC141854287 n=1 Tax=Brevipalpus obovatus TaxID=246614 RepID=UPI003D9E929D
MMANHQKCPCNFTIGMYSMSPFYVVEVVDNKIHSSIEEFEPLFAAFEVPEFRILPKYIGDISDPRMSTYFERGEIEFYPYLRALADATSPEEISPIIIGSAVKMVTGTIKEKYVPTDWISVLGIFDELVWIGILITIMMISLIIWWKNKISEQNSGGLVDAFWSIFYQRKRKFDSMYDIFWSSFATLANQGSIGSGPRILVLFFSVFVLLLLALFNGMVNTDLVAPIKPFQVDSLEDVLRPEASQLQPLWRKPQKLYQSFENSPPDSVKGKIWKKATANGLDKALIMVEDGKSEWENREKFMNVIYFDMNAFIQLFALYSCLYSIDNQKVQIPHVSRDAVANELLVFPLKFQNDSCYEFKKKRIPTMFMNFFENGQLQMYIGPKNVILNTLKRPLTTVKCKIEEAKAKTQAAVEQVTLVNIPELFRSFFFLLLICTIVFFVELYVKRLSMTKIQPIANYK